MISINIADPLAEAANVQAKMCHRGLNYWARIGKIAIAEENPDLSFEFIKAILNAKEEILAGHIEPYSFD